MSSETNTITLAFRGKPEVAFEVASSLASLDCPVDGNSVEIQWGTPSCSMGIADTTVQLLGTLGILSFPISVFAGIVGNNLFERFKRAKAAVAAKAPQLESALQEVDLQLSFRDPATGGNVDIRLEIKSTVAMRIDVEYPIS